MARSSRRRIASRVTPRNGCGAYPSESSMRATRDRGHDRRIPRHARQRSSYLELGPRHTGQHERHALDEPHARRTVHALEVELHLRKTVRQRPDVEIGECGMVELFVARGRSVVPARCVARRARSTRRARPRAGSRTRCDSRRSRTVARRFLRTPPEHRDRNARTPRASRPARDRRCHDVSGRHTPCAPRATSACHRSARAACRRSTADRARAPRPRSQPAVFCERPEQPRGAGADGKQQRNGADPEHDHHGGTADHRARASRDGDERVQPATRKQRRRRPMSRARLVSLASRPASSTPPITRCIHSGAPARRERMPNDAPIVSSAHTTMSVPATIAAARPTPARCPDN